MKEKLQIGKGSTVMCGNGVLIFAFAASLLLFIFIRLTREMLEGETRHFDEMILLGLRQASDLAIPIGPAWLTKMMTDLTALGGTTVLSLMTVLVVFFLLLRGSTRTSAFVTVSIMGGWLLSTSLKLGVARSRPELVSHLVVVSDFSFPSGHAMLSAVTYLTLGALVEVGAAAATQSFLPFDSVAVDHSDRL